MGILDTIKAPSENAMARAAMFTRQRPGGCTCVPTTRKLSADMEVRLTGWPNHTGCFAWVVDVTGEKAICRFFPTMSPNEVHLNNVTGGIVGGEFEDIHLEPNWGGRALEVLTDLMRERGLTPAPAIMEFMSL
jgi:hypothetical protein